MLVPKKIKYRKWHTARSNKNKVVVETRGATLSFGSFGLKALSSARVASNQIEAARKAMVRHLTKQGKLWIRIFPDRPVTQKGAETPMGSGKGEPVHYCFSLKPGRVIFEVDGVSPEVAKESLRKAGTKLPFKTKIVSRQ